MDKLLGSCEDAVHDGVRGCFTERQVSICPTVPNDLTRRLQAVLKCLDQSTIAVPAGNKSTL